MPDKPLTLTIRSADDPGSKINFNLRVNIAWDEVARWPLDRRRALCDGIALILEARDDSGQLRRLKSEISERLALFLAGESRKEMIEFRLLPVDSGGKRVRSMKKAARIKAGVKL